MPKELEEALKCFDKVDNTINLNWQKGFLRVGIDVCNRSDCNDDKEMNDCLDTIKQVLLKAQEQESENAKYKQLEEQLGIDLLILFKALNNGVYYRNAQKEICFAKPKSLALTNLSLRVNYSTYKWLYDYKKTWWLKEDKSE